MAFDMAKFLARFAEEAREHVAKLNEGLVRLENNPGDAENMNAIFRSAHTIKGSSRMMKLTLITEAAHRLEDALGALRDGKIRHSKELADLLFRAVDAISDMVENTSAGKEITMDNSGLCDDLAKAAEGALSSPVQEGNKETGALVSPPAKEVGEQAAPALGERPAAGNAPCPEPSPEQHAAAKEARPKPAETVRINSEKLDELVKLMGEIVSSQNRFKQRLHDIREIEGMAGKYMELLARAGHCDSPGGSDGIPGLAHSLFLKVKQLAAAARDDINIQELLTSELQGKTLTLRMVPLSAVFDSLPRMVRDISKNLGKDIVLVVEGGDIELDKKMIDKLGDPLVHMLRNSVDHGIEPPEERQRAGKPGTGTVKLSACYDAGSVLIELSDDGGGIPLEKIKEKALRKKLFSEAELNDMPESALVDLIFQPGFSTNSIVTDVSGRGVGMDVARRNIVGELRGSFRIETKRGKGASFFIRLPLTLAVMRVLLVDVAGMVFAFGAHDVSEIIRVPKDELITVVDKRAVRLREEIIPVADMASVLNLPAGGKTEKGVVLVAIVHTGGEKLGLIIDALRDEEDMVIKPLPAHMKNIRLVSGVIISGRNEIINVVHIPAVMEAAGEIREGEPLRETAGEESGAIHILVVDDSINTREIEKSILESYGYKVDLAGDGIEALEKIREFRYSVVITDVEMPRLDGFSLTERLRNDEAHKDIPVIIMTSREKEEDKKRGIKVGADAYIVKGAFDQSNLLETVRNLIG